jgi:anti-sigma factor ChrR (cupin superfamily)
MTALLLLAALGLSAADPAKPIQFAAEDVRWSDGPPSLPAGTKVAVLEGDPKQRGLFTMRLKVPGGAKIAPHWHPREERVTVLAGSVLVGFGATFDEKAGKRFPAGAFYVNPPKLPHFVWTDEEAVLQLTGMGPWALRYVKP